MKIINEAINTIQGKIAEVFDPSTNKKNNQSHATRLKASENIIFNRLKLKDEGTQIRTYGELRNAARVAHEEIRELKKGTKKVGFDSDIGAFVTQTFDEVCKALRERFTPAAAPASAAGADDGKKPDVDGAGRKTERAIEPTIAAQKMAILLRGIAPKIFERLQILREEKKGPGSQGDITKVPLVSNGEKISAEYADVFAMYMLCVDEAMTTFVQGGKLTLQVALVDLLKKLDSPHKQDFRNWTNALFPEPINRMDLQGAADMANAPISLYEGNGGFHTESHALLMPEKYAFLQTRTAPDAEVLWQMTQEEKLVLEHFWMQRQAQEPQVALQENVEFLTDAAKHVNARCNGGMPLVRSVFEVQQHIWGIEDEAGIKIAGTVKTKKDPEPTPGQGNGSLPADGQAPSEASLNMDKGVARSEAAMLEQSGATLASEPSQSIGLSQEPLAAELCNRALEKLKGIVSTDISKGDQVTRFLVRAMYERLMQRKEVLWNDPSQTNAFDEFMIEYMLTMTDRSGATLMRYNANVGATVKPTTVFPAKFQQYLAGASMILNDLQKHLPADETTTPGASEAADLARRIDIECDKGLRTMATATKFQNLKALESVDSNKYVSQAMLLQMYPVLEIAQHTLAESNTLPDGVSKEYIEVLLAYSNACMNVYGLDSNNELKSNINYPDYAGSVEELFASVRHILETKGTCVLPRHTPRMEAGALPAAPEGGMMDTDVATDVLQKRKHEIDARLIELDADLGVQQTYEQVAKNVNQLRAMCDVNPDLEWMAWRDKMIAHQNDIKPLLPTGDAANITDTVTINVRKMDDDMQDLSTAVETLLKKVGVQSQERRSLSAERRKIESLETVIARMVPVRTQWQALMREYQLISESGL